MERNNSLKVLMSELKLSIIENDIEEIRNILDYEISDLANIQDVDMLKTAMGLYKLASESLKKDNQKISKEMRNISKGIALNNATTNRKAYGLYSIII